MGKHFTSIVLLVLAAALTAAAQGHLSERVYVSTDRDVYVAGDEVFLSAFCLDMTAGGLSGGSSVAYVEVISAEGPVQTAKIALSKGRGGGFIRLDNTIPTGQYKLVAYTAQCFNEVGYDFEEGAKVLSIINPFTTARSSSGVEVLSDEEYEALPSPSHTSAGSVAMEDDGRLILTNRSDKAVTMSVSIRHDDGLVVPQGPDPVSFASGATRGTSFTSDRLMDFEGEVIRTRLVAEDTVFNWANGVLAYLSVPGRKADFYVSRLDSDGSATFFTHNIYGDNDIVLEIGYSASPCHLEVVSPFAGVKATGLPALPLSPGLAGRIRDRSVAMQVHAAAGADSLYEVPALPQDFLFPADSVEYILDDYTRFPLMEELFVEFIGKAHVGRNGRERSLVMSLNDSFKPSAASTLPSLVLLDGVPVTDQNAILDYDPLLVERIVLYPHTFYIGGWPFSGVINFCTYKHDLPSFAFRDNARIVGFQGVSYPVIVRHPDSEAGIPDLRRTILWCPEVELAPGESRSLEYTLPSYEGRFEAVAEGFDAAGNPQYVRTVVGDDQ